MAHPSSNSDEMEVGGKQVDKRYKVAVLVNIMQENRRDGSYRLTRKTWYPEEIVPNNILHIPLDARGKEFVDIKLTKVITAASSDHEPTKTSQNATTKPHHHKER